MVVSQSERLMLAGSSLIKVTSPHHNWTTYVTCTNIASIDLMQEVLP